MRDINLFKNSSSVYLKEISSKAHLKKDENCEGYLVKSNESEARKIIDSLRGTKKIIAVYGSDNTFNRRAIETLKINYLVSPESGIRKDTLKQRDSGLNHVIAKDAKRRGIEFVIDLSSLNGLNKKEKALKISRIIQNIKVCRKAKCEIRIASLARNEEGVLDESQRKSIGYSFGMSSGQVERCCEF